MRAGTIFRFAVVRRLARLHRCRECGAVTDAPTDHARWHAGVPLNVGSTEGRPDVEITVPDLRRAR